MLGFDLGLCVYVRIRRLAWMVRVRVGGWITHYADEGPHKDSTRKRVSVCMCVCVFLGRWSSNLGSVPFQPDRLSQSATFGARFRQGGAKA